MSNVEVTINDQYYSELKAAIKKADKGHDLELINKAYSFAKKAHKGQFRLSSGQPFISHPVSVALILLELGMDTSTISAGLLHDVVEDTNVSVEVLQKEFGLEVAAMVEGVTKLESVIKRGGEGSSKKIVDGGLQQQQIENIRKMLLATAKDVRVIIVKLADRLHNMRTANGWVESKRRKKALETMEIYVPLSQRLGMTVVKEELQNLALKILDPIAYDEISKMLKFKQRNFRTKKLNGKSYIEHLESRVFHALKPMISDFKIGGRVKSHCALYFKIYVNGKDWDEVFDIYAIRIVVNTILECYGVLCAIHNLFKPLQNRFKDYIATPKANFYQSLHTTVMDDEFGTPFEVQIRTKQMQYVAEYGIAAHWKYKQKILGNSKIEEKLSWVRRIIEMQQESENVDDFFRLFKTDLGSEEVFVFTPKGEVKSLPALSTVIDFAYLIGADVGNRMVGAKIDGKSVPIETKIESNQVIEIVTTNAKNYGPKRSWLSVAKTSVARNKIRAWLKKERRHENILRGREELKKEFLRNGIELKKVELQAFVKKIANFQNLESVDDFYAAVGYGAINVSKIMNKIKQTYLEFKEIDLKTSVKFANAIKISNQSLQIFVEGVGNCFVKLSKCCSPIPGCKIIGYITEKRRISVHCLNCANVGYIQKNVSRQNRFVNVQFDESLKKTYYSSLKIVTQNSYNVVGAINLKLISLKVKVKNLNVEFSNSGAAQIRLLISVFCVDQLKNVVCSLKKVKGVSSVAISTKF